MSFGKLVSQGGGLRVLHGTSNDVSSRLLGPEEMLLAGDTGARYLGVGPSGAPRGLVTGLADGVLRIERLTQAQYDALGAPDATTLYLIIG